MTRTRQLRPGIDSATSRKMNTRSLAVVSLLTDLTSNAGTFAGQTAFCLADNMLYRWDGAAWIAEMACGSNYTSYDQTVTTHEARYIADAVQSIPNATDTKLQFPTARTACADVTASGTGNTDFLLNRAGLWYLSACTRFLGAAGGLERHVFLQTGTAFNTANRVAFHTDVNVSTGGVFVHCSTEIRVAAGTSVFAAGFQNSGGAINTQVVGDSLHMAMVWLRP